MDTIVQQRSQLEEKQAIIAKLERLLPAEPVQHTVIRPVRRITETGYRFNFGSDSHVFRRQSTVEQCPSP